MIAPAKIQVRYSDCDMMGHVNNAVYLNYFENTRMYYFEKLVGKEWDYNSQGMVLVKNELEYIKPIFLQEKPEVYMYLVGVGHKSITFGYKVMVDGELRTHGKSVLVCFDPKTNQSVPIYPEFIEAFKKLDNE